MPRSNRTYIWIAASATLSMLLAAYGNHTLNADRPNALVLTVFGIAFVTLTCALVPLSLRVFLRAQRAMGHGEHALVRALGTHELPFVRAVWLVFALGLLLGLPFLVREACGEEPAQGAPLLE